MRKLLVGLASVCFLLTLGFHGTFAQGAKQDMKDAGQDMKEAGKSTERATKKTGKAVKKTAKKATHKSARKVRKGAAKVEDKTEPERKGPGPGFAPTSAHRNAFWRRAL